MPENDSNYSLRWIKGLFSKQYKHIIKTELELSDSMKKKREAGIWQRRYWEHTLLTQKDFNAHVNNIHYNPVKNGLVKNVSDWPWSTFHKYVRHGTYDPDWGSDDYEYLNGIVNSGE